MPATKIRGFFTSPKSLYVNQKSTTGATEATEATEATYPSTHPPTHPSTHPSTHPPTHPPTEPPPREAQEKEKFINQLCKKWKWLFSENKDTFKEKMIEIGGIAEKELQLAERLGISEPQVNTLEFVNNHDGTIKRKILKDNIQFSFFTFRDTSPPDQTLNINGIYTTESLPMMTQSQRNNRFNPTIERPNCIVTVTYKDNKLVETNSVPAVMNKHGIPIIRDHSYTNTYTIEEGKLIEETSVDDVSMKQTYEEKMTPKGGIIKRIRRTKKRKLRKKFKKSKKIRKKSRKRRTSTKRIKSRKH